jgi:hypothetical protein
MDHALTSAPHQRLRETITPRAAQNRKPWQARKHLAYLQLADSADAGPPAGRHGQPAADPETTKLAVP